MYFARLLLRLLLAMRIYYNKKAVKKVADFLYLARISIYLVAKAFFCLEILQREGYTPDYILIGGRTKLKQNAPHTVVICLF